MTYTCQTVILNREAVKNLLLLQFRLRCGMCFAMMAIKKQKGKRDSFMEQKREIRYFGLIYLLMVGSSSFGAYATNFYREVGLNGSQIGLITSTANLLALAKLFEVSVEELLR